MSLTKQITDIIDTASDFGLRNVDIDYAKEMIESREFGLAIEIIVQQLYEHDVKIDMEFYELVKLVSKKMQLPEEEYNFLHGLIRE